MSLAKKFSYTPYSGFRVGAALLTVDGRVIKGACVDNASYGECRSRYPFERWDQGLNRGDFLRRVDLCRAYGACESGGECSQPFLLEFSHELKGPFQSEGIRSFIGLAVTS